MKRIIRIFLATLVIVAIGGGGYFYLPEPGGRDRHRQHRKLHAGCAGETGRLELHHQCGRPVGRRAKQLPGFRTHERDGQAADAGRTGGQHRDGNPGAGDHRRRVVPAGARPGEERPASRRGDPGGPEGAGHRARDRAGRRSDRYGGKNARAGQVRPGRSQRTGPDQPGERGQGCGGYSEAPADPERPGRTRFPGKERTRSSLHCELVRASHRVTGGYDQAQRGADRGDHDGSGDFGRSPGRPGPCLCPTRAGAPGQGG